jgi:hypothetical protein
MNWTAEQDAQLLKLWPHQSSSLIAPIFGCTRNAVIGRVYRLRAAGERAAVLSRASLPRPPYKPRPVSPEYAARTAKIVAMRRRKRSLTVIGNRFGITRQRVFQILAAHRARLAMESRVPRSNRKVSAEESHP